jgi:hypothetical protein
MKFSFYDGGEFDGVLEHCGELLKVIYTLSDAECPLKIKWDLRKAHTDI